MNKLFLKDFHKIQRQSFNRLMRYQKYDDQMIFIKVNSKVLK